MDDEQDGARAVVVNDCDDVKVARVSQAVRSQDPTGEPHVKRLRAAIAKELCVRRPGGGVARQQDTATLAAIGDRERGAGPGGSDTSSNDSRAESLELRAQAGAA